MYIRPKTREEVYRAIDTEREYQTKMWGVEDADTTNRPHSIGEQILLIEEYAARARYEWAITKAPEVMALHTIRKIAGIAVNCMEHHGAPLRESIEFRSAHKAIDPEWDPQP